MKEVSVNLRVWRRLAVVGAFLALLVSTHARAQEEREWTWRDRKGKTRTRAELDAILAQHKRWLQRTNPENLSTDVLKVPPKLNSPFRKGGGISLWNEVQDAENLSGAKLYHADLKGAELGDENLSNADLTDADLKDADLTDSRLTNANLTKAELHGADLDGANLRGANFEPKSNPEARNIAYALWLEYLTYASNPGALVQLRKQFQENGFRFQERKITYVLNRERVYRLGLFESWFQRVAFDLTCQYGMNPGRALQIWFALFVFCWLVYAVLIHSPIESGIYQIKKSGEFPTKEVEEQIRPRTISQGPLWQNPLRLLYKEFRVLFWAGFFSLMSAFNIGFRDINFGRWLRLLPRTEYDLKAKGWARTVAGLQSLISVYLIALWVLTYFGRPFE
jgi:hypothetical protein